MKKTIIAAIVVLVLVVAAVGIYFTVLDKDDKDPNDVTFLIQDSQGVYFWIDGNGETVQDALVDAFSSYPEGTLVTSNYGISTLFGIGTTSSGGVYSWWVQYSWKNDAWTYNSEDTMVELKSSDLDYFLVIYGAGGMEGIDLPEDIAKPSDAKVWDGNTSGVLFTIESSTGLYFNINGSGKTVYDSMVNANSKFNMGFIGSEDPSGKGIKSLFGLEMIQFGGVWSWWSTYVLTDDGKNWESSFLYIGNMESSENAQVCLIYTDGTFEPSAPVHE
jgi:hypothetical protein